MKSIARQVVATSFADAADVRRFRRCKRSGATERGCFRVGDNGVGCWGDDTTAPVPMCALPREMWAALGVKARGALVVVTHEGREVVCELRDTMPSLRFITNGAGIDLSPAACAALGLVPPVRAVVWWRWKGDK